MRPSGLPGRLLLATLAGLAFCALWAPTGASAQTVYGVLLERGTDRPVDLALVMLITTEGDSVAATLSDEEGNFRLDADVPGDYRLVASGLGYRPTLSSSVLSLPKGTAISLQFRIEPRPLEIAGLTVDAMASRIRQPRLVQNGFVDRVQRGMGRFITPYELAKSPAPSTSDLLARTGRVTTRYHLGGDEIIMLGPRGYCVPTVFLDGQRLTMSEMSIDAMAPKFDLEAVEVYRSAVEAPARFGGGGEGCGIIVLWTKSR